MTNCDRDAILRYINELEAAALSYAEKYGPTAQLNKAVRARPSNPLWNHLFAPMRHATLGAIQNDGT